jgi:amidophosphoribosyltransferase
VVVDDSIVRGNTQRAIVRMLREAGAREVHVRISSPPVKWPCFYGIDFATRAELIANGLAVDEIRTAIGADSLGYVSLEGLVETTGVAMDRLCRACFDGVYPVELPHPEQLGKHLLEGLDHLESQVLASEAVIEVEAHPQVTLDVDGLRTLIGGGGAADALDRP